VDRSSSGAGASSSGKCKLRLQLVVSGACMAGIRQQHVSGGHDCVTAQSPSGKGCQMRLPWHTGTPQLGQ
jgi:hypothetical protein